jgi:hypothetical protein
MRAIANCGSDSHNGPFAAGPKRFAEVGAGLIDFAEFGGHSALALGRGATWLLRCSTSF